MSPVRGAYLVVLLAALALALAQPRVPVAAVLLVLVGVGARLPAVVRAVRRRRHRRPAVRAA